MNYFEVFGLPVSCKIDEDVLTSRYLQKQSCVHPDVCDESEKSSYLNAAYSVLSDPINRAKYFLEIHKKDVNEMSSELAAKAFSLREEYESLKSTNDKKEFQRKLSERISKLIIVLHSCEEDLGKFQKEFSLLFFINSFLEKIKSDVYFRD